MDHSSATAGPGRLQAIAGHLATLGAALLVALAVPLVILALGAPVALVVRFILEIGRRL